MLKQIVSTGLALGVVLGGSAAFTADTEAGSQTSQTSQTSTQTNVDLATQLNADLSSGTLTSSQEFETLAEQNNWTAHDLDAWAEANNMTEAELQEWAGNSGWSQQDRAQLDLDANANIQLSTLLNSNNSSSGNSNGLLGNIL